MFSSKIFRSAIAMTALGLSVTAYAGNSSGPYNVELNKTEVLRLSQPAAAVIVGNPQIADVSVHSSDTVFVIGRGYGQTNLIIMNSLGETIMDAAIQVTSNTTPGNVRVYAGADRASYHCTPYCLPSPVLGDDPKFVGKFTPQSPTIQNSTISAGTGASQGFQGGAYSQSPSSQNFGPGSTSPADPIFSE